MIVSNDTLDTVIENLCHMGPLGLDTETTGLTESDRLFSLIISDSNMNYYFNFQSYEGVEPLHREYVLGKLQERLFRDPHRTWYIHNAKFDMRMLAKEGCELVGRVHCSQAIERVVQNNYMDGARPYSLAACAARRGLQKDESVEEYISKHKLITKVRIPGKKKLGELKHFDRVPFDIISKYGEMDGHLARTIGISQYEALRRMDAARPEGVPPINDIYENEVRLTRTCFRMERKGIMIDRPFVAKALQYEMDEIKGNQNKFLELTGHPYEDSKKLFKDVFDAAGEVYPLTEKGNPSFAADVLEEMKSPVAAVINKIRYHEKRAGTYYSSFLHLATDKDLIHADAQQGGTETGRMSYRDPNLQNVPKEDDEDDQLLPYHVRESFMPRPGRFYLSKDYRQMEYKVMMDYAGETKIIERINDGEDFHDAIAAQCKITRKQAKTLNFAIGYGAGPKKIADMLGISMREAKELIATYFGNLPKLQMFFRQVQAAGEARGYIFNRFGRRCNLYSKRFSYILPNHLIQGTCADVVKFSMNKIDDLLLDKKTDLLLQVHDELLFESVREEIGIFDDIGRIMESTYPSMNGVILTTSTEHSFKNWGYRDKIAGVPGGNLQTAG